jgi:hypothetical protein
LQITLSKRDGGYGNVEVYINGKEVTSDARGGGFDPGDTVVVVSYNLQNNPYLIPGAVNIITVKTQSEDGYITSKGAKTLVPPKGPAPKLDTSFYAVICGVNDYRNPNMRLRYGQPDALAISAAVKRGAENLFGRDKTYIYTLTSPGDMPPNKDNLWKVFCEIQQKAKPQDILLLYFSGHGILWGKNDSVDFYYLAQNAGSLNTAAYNNDSVRWNSTVSAREFMEWIKVIPTHMQALVFDACASGKAADVFRKSSDLISEKAGVFVLSGCADSASSYESNRYEHGILTYALLKVMKDNVRNNSKGIQVNAWLFDASLMTPDLAEAIKRTQVPWFNNEPGAKTFYIGKLELSDREAIKLPE